MKFLRRWPFIGRVRLCFVEPPYFQMTVKPIFTHGLDVTVLPGIAGWLDKLLSLVFEQTLVQPNMLVVHVEKLVSPQPEQWFTIDEKQPVGYVLVEVIEAADMKPSDLNGLADPYVKGQLGPYKFRTKTQKKTLAPKWHEEFKVPICTWESPNILAIEVRDKDRFVDDKMGECSMDVNDFRDGQRHEIWLSLQNVKVGRLHIAISIVEGNVKACDEDLDQYKRESFATDTSNKDSFSSATSEKSSRVGDKFEPIDVEGRQETGIWVHRPGNEVSQVWEPRKGKSRRLDTEILSEGVESGSFKSKASGPLKSGGINGDESLDAEKEHSPNRVQRGFQKIGSVFHRRSRIDEKNNYPEVPVSSPHVNLRSVNSKREIGVKIIVDDATSAAAAASALKTLKTPRPDEKESSEDSGSDSPHKVKDVAKNILRQAGKSARGLKHALSRKGSRKFKSDFGEQPPKRDDASGSSNSSSSKEESTVDVIGVEAIQVPSEPTSGCYMISTNSSASNVATNTEEPVNRIPEASKAKDNNTSSLVEKTGPVASSGELPVTHVAMEEDR